MLIGTGKSLDEASKATISEVKAFLGKPNLADSTVEAYQRNWRKLIPTQPSFNATDTQKVETKVKDALVKAGLTPKGAENIVDDLNRPAGAPSGGAGGAGGRGAGGARKDYKRLREWLKDYNPDIDPDLVDDLVDNWTNLSSAERDRVTRDITEFIY